MLFVFAHCCYTLCKQSMNKHGRWIGSHKHLDRFCGDCAAKLCADVLHYEINCHMIVSSVPWMDDGTDGWMESVMKKDHDIL